MVKSLLASPYFNKPYRSTSLLHRIRRSLINVPIPETSRDRVIDISLWPTHVDDAGILHFPPTNDNDNDNSRPERQRMKNRVIKPDLVIFATGYTQSFPFLSGNQYPLPAECDVRGIWRSDDASTAFIGFVRPTIGAIPPLAEMQAMRWLLHLLSPGLLPDAPPGCRRARITGSDGRSRSHVLEPYELDFALHPHGARDLWATKRGIDGEAYTYQLALDMGCAPTFAWLWTNCSWRALWTWAMGPNFNPKFRLVGPWEDRDVAVPIMEGELFDVTSRTGGWVFFLTYTFFPGCFFATVALAACGATLLGRLGESAAAWARRLFWRVGHRKAI